MKKRSKRVIIDTNLWIRFLIFGIKLLGNTNYYDERLSFNK